MGAPTSRTVEIIVPDVPEAVWGALHADAEARDVSRNEAAVSILAERYGVTREPSQVRFRSRGEFNPDRPLQLVVPIKLRTKLRRDALRREATIRGLVIEALAEHYSIPFDSPQRRPRVRAA
jgi:hypothetical protein